MTVARLIAVDDESSVDSLSATPCVLVVGNFDGVHLGHQAVLGQAVDQARSLGVSANVLSDRLDTLVGEGILQRSVYQTRPERHEYVLTKKGADLIPALIALMQWGDRWAWPEAKGPVRVQHDACGHDVRLEVRCPHCRREAAPGELRATPRAGVVHPPAEHEPGAVSGRRLLAGGEGVKLASDPGEDVEAQRSPS